MSVSDNYSPVRTLGNGTTDEFSGSWAVLNADYVKVYLEEVATGDLTLQTITTHYEIEFDADGFTVTFVTPPSSSYYAYITREVEISQDDPLKTSKGFQGEVIENALDKLTAISQDLRYDVDNLGDTADDVAAAEAAAVAAAASAAALAGTSTTSVLIATGSKVFTTQSGKSFNNAYVFVSSAADPTNYMSGTAVYSGTTLTVTVPTGGTGGSGTYADWFIQVSGVKGATGATGPAGAGSGDMLKSENLSGLANNATAFATIKQAATDTATGVVELATDAETITGTDTARAVTPANIQAKVASETAMGIVELATTAEAVTGTDTARAVTCAGVAAAIAATGSVVAAAQSDQETATSTTLFVSPGRQQYHPGHPKFWVRSPGSSTMTSSYNMTSITDDGVGVFILNIATDFSNANYSFVGMAAQTSANSTDDLRSVCYNTNTGSATLAAGVLPISTKTIATGSGAIAAVDCVFCVAGFGDQ